MPISIFTCSQDIKHNEIFKFVIIETYSNYNATFDDFEFSLGFVTRTQSGNI